MKIYTKTGDKGKTSLVGGQRVEKTHIRLEAYGTIDELNSFIGLLMEYLKEKKDLELLDSVQFLLFSVGCNLASEPDKEVHATCRISKSAIEMLETAIDRMDAALPPLKCFVMPAGGKSSSLAHICRTIARRAERRIYEVAEHWPVDEDILVFINRLSDYFFVLARKECYLNQKEEKKWDNPCK